jgi:hypothetical protein
MLILPLRDESNPAASSARAAKRRRPAGCNSCPTYKSVVSRWLSGEVANPELVNFEWPATGNAPPFPD